MTRFRNFYQISRILPNFKNFTKFQTLEKNSKFWPNFTVSAKFHKFLNLRNSFNTLGGQNPLILDFNCQFLRRVPFVLCLLALYRYEWRECWSDTDIGMCPKEKTLGIYQVVSRSKGNIGFCRRDKVASLQWELLQH